MPKSLKWAFLAGGVHGAHGTHEGQGFVPIERARISPLDRGFLFGDAVYEVMPVYAGRVFALDRHLKRLARSLREVAIADPFAAERWAELIEELVVRNGGGDQLIYLQVSRGADEGRDHRFPQGVPPTVFMMGSPYAPPTVERFASGRSAFTQPDLRWGRCDIKTVMLMANCMAKEFAGERGLEVTERISENGNFLALTLTIQAQSQQQVDDIYRALTKHPLVMMAL